MKKLSIVLTIALVVALAVPAMAASNLKVNGNFEVENAYDDTATQSSKTEGALELYLDANVNEDVTFFSEIDLDYNHDGTTTPATIAEAWVKVDNAFGPVGLKAGRIEETAPDAILYDVVDEGAELTYDSGNVVAKFGHSIDSNGKAVFAEGKATGLGVVDAVTLNYVDYNVADYDGYTVKVDKSHSFGNASLLFGTANDADVIDLNFSTAQLVPGVTASIEYGSVEDGFTDGVAQDSVFTDSALVGLDDLTVIKPGVNFDVTDKLNVDFSYAMYETDKVDAQHDYLDLVASYDLAKDTYLEVEYEDNAFDGTGTSEVDSTAVTTTLGVNF